MRTDSTPGLVFVLSLHLSRCFSLIQELVDHSDHGGRGGRCRSSEIDRKEFPLYTAPERTSGERSIRWSSAPIPVRRSCNFFDYYSRVHFFIKFPFHYSIVNVNTQFLWVADSVIFNEPSLKVLISFCSCFCVSVPGSFGPVKLSPAQLQNRLVLRLKGSKVLPDPVKVETTTHILVALTTSSFRSASD